MAVTLNPLNAVLPGQTLTDESTPTTESIAPEPNSNTAFDIVTPSYVPIPSTSKCVLGQGTSFLIPIGPELPGQIPIKIALKPLNPHNTYCNFFSLLNDFKKSIKPFPLECFHS